VNGWWCTGWKVLSVWCVINEWVCESATIQIESSIGI
jgi:hypothetical protein